MFGFRDGRPMVRVHAPWSRRTPCVTLPRFVLGGSPRLDHSVGRSLGRSVDLSIGRSVDLGIGRSLDLGPGRGLRAAAARARSTSLVVPSVCAALLLACGSGPRQVLLPAGGREPPEIRDACNRAELRCSGCHPLDRVVSLQRRGHTDWAQQVRRMRLKPASGITVAEADLIVTCLVYIDGTRSTAEPGGHAAAMPGADARDAPTPARRIAGWPGAAEFALRDRATPDLRARLRWRDRRQDREWRFRDPANTPRGTGIGELPRSKKTATGERSGPTGYRLGVRAEQRTTDRSP